MIKMAKIRTSLGCPFCNGSNITTKEKKSERKSEISYYDKESLEKIYKVDYECHCKDCNKDYKVDYGYEHYTIFNSPINLAAWAEDNKLLAEYTSDSDMDYQIIKGYLAENDSIYFIKVYDDEYPIFITKKQLEEFIYNVEKTKTFIFNTWMNRHR